MQLQKLTNEELDYLEKLLKTIGDEKTNRIPDIEKYGYSTKWAYNTVRLLNEVEQILTEGDLDLERNREQLKSIRRGEWTEESIYTYFDVKERSLEELYSLSTLRHSPDEEAIKDILLKCLEEYYGSLDKMIHMTDNSENILKDLEKLLDKYK